MKKNAMNTLTLMNKNTALSKWIYLLALSLIWGSSFILIKKGLTGFGYFEAATIRLMSAGLATKSIRYLDCCLG